MREVLPSNIRNDFQDWFQTKVSEGKGFSKISSVEKSLHESRVLDELKYKITELLIA